MESKILQAIGIDPGYIFIFLIVLILLMFIFYVKLNMKYNRLKSSYSSFMRGKDGKNLEKSILTKFEEIDGISSAIKKNTNDIRRLNREVAKNYQKFGLVRYDAFNEMGGNLSFAITLLDGNNSGFILNAMHSREGCYTYTKEIVRGESYIELSEEEVQSLEKAMFQEVYDPEVQSIMKKKEKKKQNSNEEEIN